MTSIAGEATSSVGAGSGHDRTGSEAIGFLSRLITRAVTLVGSLLLTFLGLTAVTFCIGRFIPIDPVVAVVGDRATREVYEAARTAMGLDRSIPMQYLIYLKKVLSGDLGNSVITSHPVLADLIHFFPATFELATIATLIGVAVGVPAGVMAAAKQGRAFDHVVRLVGLFGYSMPVFWLGLVGLLLFYARLGWVEGPGRLDVSYDDIVPTVTGLITIDSLIAGESDVFWNALSHLVLPASILGYLSLAYVARMTRSFMLSQLRQEYVLATLAKGLSPFRVVWVHALGNVWVQLVTVIALTFGSLLEGAVLTETVFAWPGLGLYMKNSLFNADLNAVLGGTLVIGVVYIFLNMLSDVIYPLVDPRARGRG